MKSATDESIKVALDFQEQIIQECLALLEELEQASRFYPLQKAEDKGIIRRPSGLYVPERVEEHRILVNDFRQVMVNAFIKTFRAMHGNMANPLFGLSQRTLLEMATRGLFIELSPSIPAVSSTRVAVLTMLDHEYNYGSKQHYSRLRTECEELLTERDLAQSPENLNKYMDKYVLWPLVQNKEKDRFRVIDIFSGAGRELIEKVLNEIVHARPIAVGVALDTTTRPMATKMRHQMLLIYSALQVLDYYAQALPESQRPEWEEPRVELAAQFPQLRTVFAWVSKNHL